LSEQGHVAATSPDETVQTGHSANGHDPSDYRAGTGDRKAQVYSPLETYWNAFQEWRKRERLRTELRLLTDSELTDIGITRGEIDYVTSNDLSNPTGFCLL
jgi:uncharacterized protein YjiS (DUF1127 family)